MTENADLSAENKISEIEARYQLAQYMMQGHGRATLVQNDTIFSTWIKGTDFFWYERVYRVGNTGDGTEVLDNGIPPIQARSSTRVGIEYRLVDAKNAINTLAFNHIEFAESLAEASNQKVKPHSLPISHLTLTLAPLIVYFSAFERRWKFEGATKKCQLLDIPIVKASETVSPNGKHIAFLRDNNVWLREFFVNSYKTQTAPVERALTHDGELDYTYGTGSTAWGSLQYMDLPALWSPDSKRLLTVRRDTRLVKTLPQVDYVPLDGTVRPQLKEFKVSYPGDKYVETFQLLTIDIETGQICEARYPPMPSCDIQSLSIYNNLVWWSADSRRVYFIDQEQGKQLLRLVEFDSYTGATQVLFQETSDTYIDITVDGISLPLHRYLPESNELLWWSERSGWGHLYLYDLNSGLFKNSISSGDWLVRDILYVDEIRREIIVQTSGRVAGRDPYYRDICRMHIDTGEITTLVSTDDDYLVHYLETGVIFGKISSGQASQETSGVSPCGSYIVATRTRVDSVPTSLLLDREGRTIMELEVADTSALPAGWQWPEPVKLLAADNSTNIYGVLFRPSDFSSDKQYPVINAINSGPWLSVVPKGSFHTSRGYADIYYFQCAALAELGFIVLLLDSRGTPLRSKKFQDESYGWIPSSANTDDHAYAIQQLAQRYPYIDAGRVGIWCLAYRSGLQNFLERQDLYKVCVQMSLIDSRLTSRIIEADKYEGFDLADETQCYPEQLVENLSGNLLLMTAMSSFTSPAYPASGLFRVIDALQKANKDFDLLIIPSATLAVNSYMYRRSWDYLVKHLQGMEPPKEFKLTGVDLVDAVLNSKKDELEDTSKA